MSRAFVAAALAVLAAGCTLGPDFVAPADEAPVRWKSAEAAEAPPIPERWWTLFADAELDRLVGLAVERNQDLRIALARVEQARAFAGIARAQQWPTVSVDPSVEREGFSANRAAPPGASTPGYTSTNIQVPLLVAYEVDLWGRIRRTREAAEAASRATDLDYAALSLAISSEVARTWFAVQSARREEDVLRAGADLRRRAFVILQGRAAAGIGDDLDSSRAQAELATVEADLRRVERGRAALENALAVLCGHAPAEFTASELADAHELPVVPAGLPSELLRRRPDVAAAVERLHEASARIGATAAEAYPRLALTGAAGFASSDLSNLFDASSQAWSLGAAMSAPIFAGGEFDERNRAAAAFYEERSAEYQATLLTAFREVDDALSAIELSGAELDLQAEARAAAQHAFELAEARYRQGLIGFLDVVDAARTELDARRAVVRLELVRAESTVFLIQALGGGWGADDAAGT
jgi:multidrug efflux system outer membrane protein